MKQTQTAMVVNALKRGRLTYFGMIAAAGTPHAHRRALEWIERNTDWRLEKDRRADGVIVWRIVKAR